MSRKRAKKRGGRRVGAGRPADPLAALAPAAVRAVLSDRTRVLLTGELQAIAADPQWRDLSRAEQAARLLEELAEHSAAPLLAPRRRRSAEPGQ